MSGFCTVSMCTATAACAPKLEDSTCEAWPCASAQATRASASIASSCGSRASRSSAGLASAWLAASLAAAVRLMGALRSGCGGSGDGGRFGSLRPAGRGLQDLDMGGVGRQVDQAGAVQEVAKALVRAALCGVAGQQRLQRLDDLRLGDVFPVQRVQSLAAVVGTE